MKYVYVIRSKKIRNQYYTGITSDVENRIKEHNYGKLKNTCMYKPWELIVTIGFKDEKRAHRFERYLKSGTGVVFSKKHFR